MGHKILLGQNPSDESTFHGYTGVGAQALGGPFHISFLQDWNHMILFCFSFIMKTGTVELCILRGVGSLRVDSSVQLRSVELNQMGENQS
jgi:hypothetical protein